MTTSFATRLLKVMSIAAVWSAVSPLNLWADPIVVTSGRFEAGARGTGFQFFGADGFSLSASFPDVLKSPAGTCAAGCAFGTLLDMSAVAGGESSSGSPLGHLNFATIGGVRFGSFPPTERLTGILRFDAPIVMLPTSEHDSGSGLPAPFLMHGTVSASAADDVEGRTPLFQVSLVGQGRTWITFDNFDPVKGVLFEDVQSHYEFTATPEPASLALMGTGLVAMAARRRAMRRRG
jgi:hypothetical protein